MTVCDTHKDKLSQPSQDQKDNSIPAKFPPNPCPASATGDSNFKNQGLVLLSGHKRVPETHNCDPGLNKIDPGGPLRLNSEGPTPDCHGEVRRAFPVCYDPYTGNTKNAGHCKEKRSGRCTSSPLGGVGTRGGTTGLTSCQRWIARDTYIWLTRASGALSTRASSPLSTNQPRTNCVWPKRDLPPDATSTTLVRASCSGWTRPRGVSVS